MILTTGEVGLIAVGSTLVGTLGTMYLQERRANAERKARWFKEKREVYVDFLIHASKMHKIIDRLADEVISEGAKLTKENSFFQKKQHAAYSKLAASASRPIKEIQLLGSSEIASIASRLVKDENKILNHHPSFKSKPKKTSKANMINLKTAYNGAYNDYVKKARKELEIDP